MKTIRIMRRNSPTNIKLMSTKMAVLKKIAATFNYVSVGPLNAIEG